MSIKGVRWYQRLKGFMEEWKSEREPVSEWSDDESRRVAEILMRVSELCVTDVSETVLLAFVPAMTQL